MQPPTPDDVRQAGSPTATPSPHVLALFDFDGTLTSRETFGALVAFAVPRRRLMFGRLLLWPLVVGYRLRLLPGTLVRACVVWFGFRGLFVDSVCDAGQDFAGTVLPTLMRPEAVARLRQHLGQGDTVAVVSAAFDVYLAPWCAAQGVDLLCSRLQSAGGRLTGRYAGEQCVGEEKARQVRARYELDRFAEVHAYGDTGKDLALLALAHKKFYRGRQRG